MAEVERGMDVSEMKRLLTKSKQEPVNAAVGLDGKNAVMMLHKMKQPKAVSKDLETKFKDLKNTRWGTAFVDIDADPKLVILTLNRSASGMGAKLKKTLKGTGFSKVRIQLEDGTIDEDVGEEEESESGAQAQAPDTTQPEPPVTNAPPQQQPVSEQVEAQDQQSSFDPSQLTKRLTDLVKRMLEVLKTAPDGANDLKTLATQAQAAIKAGEENAATQAVDAFAAALDNAQGANAPQGKSPDPTQQSSPNQQANANQQNGAPKNAAVLAKSRLAWVSARKKVEDEIGKLHQAMTQHYNGQNFGADLDKIFQSKVEPILTTLDQSLADKLDELGNNNDPAQHGKLADEARKIIDRYESFLTNDQMIPQLDANPFVPLQIQKTLTATLEALKKSVR